MAYAKIDVGFIRDHFSEIPEKTRPAAIALYLELVLASAEMLLDGRLPRGVVEVGAHRSGVLRGRYARREIASVASSLADSALVEIATDGMWTLLRWNEHHSSRAEVEEARSKAAKRKHKQRHGVTDDETNSAQPALSQRDFTRDAAVTSRARGTAANTKKDLPLHEGELDQPADGNTDDEEPDLEPPQEPAAAEAPATEQAIHAACKRFGAEPNIAEPWARQLTAGEFEAIIARMEMKIRRGTVERVPAQFVDLMQRQVRAKLKAATAVTIRIPTPEENLQTDVLAYARGHHPWDVAADLLTRKMAKLEVPASTRDHLLAELHAVYEEHRASDEPDLEDATPPIA